MAGLRFTKKDLAVAAAVFAAALCVYGLSAWKMDRTQTPPAAYFDELARSFLHGRLALDNPAETHDLTLYQGRWYVPFPPLPALLMLPWVAAFGGINTVLFTMILGALNVSLVFLIIRALTAAGRVNLRTGDALWLAALFGFGSVHWYMSTLGSVWFVSQICTVAFAALAVWSAVSARSPLLAGLALAGAMWARPNIVLLYPLIFAFGVSEAKERNSGSGRSFLVRWAGLSILPLCASAAGLLLYNWLRFDTPLDFGYLTQNVADFMRPDLAAYGQFSLHYAARNLQAMVLALPHWSESARALIPDEAGMSIFLTTPALIWLVRARQRSPIVLGAWLAVLSALIPLLTYYNTGWAQFGYRFSMDFMVPVMVLLAFAAQPRASVLLRVLIVAGIVVNLWGLLWFR
jgi:hypothetical protein